MPILMFNSNCKYLHFALSGLQDVFNERMIFCNKRDSYTEPLRRYPISSGSSPSLSLKYAPSMGMISSPVPMNVTSVPPATGPVWRVMSFIIGKA